MQPMPKHGLHPQSKERVLSSSFSTRVVVSRGAPVVRKPPAPLPPPSPNPGGSSSSEENKKPEGVDNNSSNMENSFKHHGITWKHMEAMNDVTTSYENLNMDFISTLTSEGFAKDFVIRALGITRNDLEMARDILNEFASKSNWDV